MVGIADAEDHERRLADRITRSPEEAQRAARGIDVARRVPRQHAVVVPFDRAAARAVIDQAHLVLEVRHRIAERGVGDEILIGRNMEQQTRCIGGVCGGDRQ